MIKLKKLLKESSFQKPTSAAVMLGGVRTDIDGFVNEVKPPKYNLIRKDVLKNRLYKEVSPLTRGLFKDEYWRGPQKVWKKFDELGLKWYIDKSEYGYHKETVRTDHRHRMPDYKV